MESLFLLWALNKYLWITQFYTLHIRQDVSLWNICCNGVLIIGKCNKIRRDTMKETEAATKRHKNISPQASALPDKDTRSFVVARDQTAARTQTTFSIYE